MLGPAVPGCELALPFSFCYSLCSAVPNPGLEE